MQLLENALRAKELYARDRGYTITGTEAVGSTSSRGGRSPAFALATAARGDRGQGRPASAPAAQVLATVGEHDYLSQYAALAGLTGTALSDADVYREIYHLDVVPIPTNRPMIRVDYPDLLYQSRQSKLAALVDDAARRQAAGQPADREGRPTMPEHLRLAQRQGRQP